MYNQFADCIELDSNIYNDYFSRSTDEELKNLVKIAIKGNKNPDNYLSCVLSRFNEQYPENTLNVMEGVLHVLMEASVRWYNTTTT